MATRRSISCSRRSTRLTFRRARPRIRCTRCSTPPATSAWMNSSNRNRSTTACRSRKAAPASFFTNLDEGVKYLTIQLFGPAQPPLFYFLVDVPGIRTDYQQVDFDALRAHFVEVHDAPRLRTALETLPGYTTRPDGGGRGDPLNFVIIGTPDEIGATLVATGWHVTEVLGPGAGWRTFKSFVLGRSYRYSPMSSLYVFGRSQDAGFQKARGSIHQRNHLRIWLTPLRYQGADVWIGAISRDIGVYFTTRAWSLTTHAIDPALA